MTTPSPNTPEYSVSELANSLKRTVETAYGYVRVRGEISGYKRAASGHAYLCLKDDAAVIDAVMWKATAGALPFRPEDGLEVIVTGKLTTYPGRSKYQIVVERMEPAGVGALLAQLEERKRRLAAEGLFDAARKRPLPDIPQVIGVVTSPTGAVIRDILHRLAERFPRRVLVWPVAVQGDTAVAQVVAALAGFNAIDGQGGIPRPDLLILARGGGSIEDLAAFNEEAVVRAVAASQIPIITAVGHETDTTLVDFASDHRAPTPTAAAERAVPVLAELRAGLGALALRQDRCIHRGVQLRRERAEALGKRLPPPRALLALKQQRYDELAERLPRALTGGAARWRTRFDGVVARLDPALRTLVAADSRKLAGTAALLRPAVLTRSTDRARVRLEAASRLLASFDPANEIRRGQARGLVWVTTADGKPVTTASAARAEAVLSLGFQDGEVPVSTALPRQGRLF